MQMAYLLTLVKWKMSENSSNRYICLNNRRVVYDNVGSRIKANVGLYMTDPTIQR